MDKRSLIIGSVIGFGIAILFIPVSLDASIPPTRAIQNLNITLPWFSEGSVLVESISSTDTFFFVSDGSTFFNVTDFAPP